MAKKLGSCGPKGYFTEKGNPVKRFYLGYDQQEAERRKSKLEELWVCQRQLAETWDRRSLAIAEAIRKGETVCYLEPSHVACPGEENAPFWLQQIQELFPCIILRLADQQLQVDWDRAKERMANELQQGADFLASGAKHFRNNESGQTLYQALDGFEKWVRGKYLENGRLRVSGKRLISNAATLKKHQSDMPLSSFGLQALESMEDHWEKRPPTEKSEVAARDTCIEQIKLIRKFAAWLHKSEEYAWRKPQDYEVRRMKIAPTQEERTAKANPEQIRRWRIDEIKTLWEYANQLERFILCLGLNCGFGAAEIRDLAQAEIQGDYIKRVRKKTLVYGEWQLWPITQQAIAWYQSHRRPKSDLPHLVLSRNGKPLLDSADGNVNATIGNWWNNLLRRIRKDNEKFRKLSFNKLRKTSGNMIRKIAGGETMAIFHARGKPVAGDEHSEVYSNRNFRRVHKAIRIMGRKLESVFASVASPFPAQQTKPHQTPAKIRRMKELQDQGFTLIKIAEIVGCSDETVRKYLKSFGKKVT